MVNIYALNNGSLQKKFFHDVSPYVRDNIILLRDFNSVIETADRKSGELDSTSRELVSLLASWHLSEVLGSHQQVFSYHHPLILERKSQIDHIYTNIQNKSLHRYAAPCSLSDHYLIGLFTIPEGSLGPKQWRFPPDILLDNAFTQQIQLMLDNFDKKTPMSSWEIIKLKIQDQSQKSTRFRQKQAKQEIAGLKSTLKKINKRIFAGDNLEFDRKLMEAHLEQCVERLKFFCKADYTANRICLEGKPCKSFLHLEDTKIQDPLYCLKDSNCVEVQSTDGMLKILQEFYSELYACNELSSSEKEIKDFLNGITSLPRITYKMNNLIGPIISKEVQEAIKHLYTRKALGCDGLISDFFKFFQDELVDILPEVFNKIYEDRTLSPSQNYL